MTGSLRDAIDLALREHSDDIDTWHDGAEVAERAVHEWLRSQRDDVRAAIKANVDSYAHESNLGRIWVTTTGFIEAADAVLDALGAAEPTTGPQRDDQPAAGAKPCTRCGDPLNGPVEVTATGYAHKNGCPA
jgi:hypothetical protein